MKVNRICRHMLLEFRDRKRFLEKLRTDFGFQKEEDWYRLKLKEIPRQTLMSLRPLLAQFDYSLANILNKTYLHHKWLPWKFGLISKGFWDDLGNQKEFLDWLGLQLGFKSMEDWYNLTIREIEHLGGYCLITRYSHSPSKLVMSVYSNHAWLPWRFAIVPRGFWNDQKHQKEFMDWLGIQLGYQKMEDWYKLTVMELEEKGGGTLLSKFGSSVFQLVASTYPDHAWINRWTEHWREDGNQKDFMDELGIQLGFKEMDDWYRINSKEILQRGGASLLTKYNGSTSKLVMSTYYEHEWTIWKFQMGSWDDLEQWQRIELVKSLSKDLKIDSLEEWYRISWAQIHDLASPIFFKRYPLEQVLHETYPAHNWDIPKLQAKKIGGIRASQRMLAKTLQEMFPESEVVENYYHKYMIRDLSGRGMELDIFLPKERLAFEYQGEQHYFDIHSLGNLWVQKEKDKEKRKACEDQGIILIEIPYWWDFEKSSLIATICDHAPYLFLSRGHGESIPTHPPNGYRKASDMELMHGEEWDGCEDLTGWWISEKMDGVRAFWNGQKLISKHSKEIPCPTWFTEELPNGVRLDGELWMGRGQLEKTVAILNSKSDTNSWKNMKFMLFDVIVSDEPYENRMDMLNNLTLPSCVCVVQTKQCLGNCHLKEQLNEIVSAGGEGIVVTKPQSLYLQERTKNRLKVKLYSDSEVQILEIVSAGFLSLQTNGKECFVGCEPSILDNPPMVGSVITVKHSGSYGNGILRHAFYWRQRQDVAWEDISQKRRVIFPNANWTKKENCKEFFDHLLEHHVGCGSLVDFYKMSIQEISKYGGKALVDYIYGGSLLIALQSLYPDHKWFALEV